MVVRHRWATRLAAAAAVGATLAAAGPLSSLPAGAAPTGTAGTSGTGGMQAGYRQTNLVSDVPGLAAMTDGDVKNPWGITFGPQTPLWVSNNGTSTSTLYAGGNASAPISAVPLIVGTPSMPTGIVFNPTKSFVLPNGMASTFIFATMSGHIAGWAVSNPPPTHTTTVVSVPGAQFTGLGIAQTAAGPRLYAADETDGLVRVYNGHFKPVGTIVDRHRPAGLQPYDATVLGNRLYVTYEPPGAPTSSIKGAIDVYTLQGSLIRRLVTGGPLDSPWGLAIAPPNWGRFSGDLLVGNEESGRITAFRLGSGRFEGTVRTPSGAPIINSGLWGLKFGNGVIGTPRTLIIAAGLDDYAHGLVAAIRPVSG